MTEKSLIRFRRLKVCDSVKGLSSENKKWRNNNASKSVKKNYRQERKTESYQKRQLFTETDSMPQSRELENMSLNLYGSGKNHSVLKCFE